MLRFLPLLFIFSTLHVLASEDELEARLLGVVDIDENEILEPLSAEDKKYVDALKSKVEVVPEFVGEEFPEIDFAEVDELRKRRDKSIKQIIKSSSARNLNFAEKEALKVQLKDILKSGTFLASVSKGTQLVHVRTGKTYYPAKDIIVYAYRLKDYEGYQLLKNKNGYISYKAPATEVVNIKEVTRMYETPYKYKPVIREIKYDIDNSKLNYEANFMLNMGLTRPVFLRDLIKEQAHIGQTLRYEASTYGKWDFPLKLGITAQWENSFGNYSAGKYNMQSFSLGPTFKSDPFTLLNAQYSFILQTRLAVFSRIVLITPGQTVNYHTSQTNLVLGLVREFKTALGRILIGANYQRQWLKASAEQYELNIGTENNYNDSFVLSVGHGTDWTW